MNAFNDLITNLALIPIKLIKLFRCQILQILLVDRHFIEEFVDRIMISENILVLLSDVLLKLVNLIFELVFFHDVTLYSTRENKNFKQVFSVKDCVEKVNKSEAFVVDRSLLFELQDQFVFINSIVGT